jgi:SPP1 gp7 family putative phage head morphogenesis protein
MSRHTALLAEMAKQTAARKAAPPKRKLVADSPKRAIVWRGKAPLRVSAGVQSRYVAAIMHAITSMMTDIISEVTKLYKSPHVVAHMATYEHVGMDASAGSQTRILTNAFKAKFDSLFADLASYLAEQMIEQINENSKQQLNTSLSGFDLTEAGKTLLLDPLMMTPAVKDMLKAATAQSAAFIKSIPDGVVNRVNDAVLSSITTGRGLEDLIPDLEKYGNQTANWAHNTAMDQTRKTFNTLNIARMGNAGITKGEWIHSGGSQKPRPLHVDYDGKSFVLSEGAPIGDDGDYVQPGEEPNCRCTFTPIIDTSRGDDTTES